MPSRDPEADRQRARERIAACKGRHCELCSRPAVCYSQYHRVYVCSQCLGKPASVYPVYERPW
jgi:hypothetical protein